MSPRYSFFVNGTILVFTQISALPQFEILLQASRSGTWRAPVFQNSMGILYSPEALLYLKPLMHFFISSMVKLWVLNGRANWNTILVGLDVIVDDCSNKFLKWSFKFLMGSSGSFALILPLLVPLPFLLLFLKLIYSIPNKFTLFIFYCSSDFDHFS